MRYIAGRRSNLFAESIAVTSSPEHARLGVAYLWDGDPGIPAAGGTTTPWDVILDGRTRQIEDPHFDTDWSAAGVPPGWTHQGAGTIARDTADKSGGVASVRLEAGARLTRWIEVAPGHRAQLVVALKGGDVGQEGGIRFEVTTENGDPVGLLSRTAGTGWGDAAAQLAVPDVGEDLVRLHLHAYRTGSTAACWVDDVRWLPAADLLTLHQVRVPRPPRGLITFSASDTDLETWTQLGGVHVRPEAWVSFAQRSARWWRLRVVVSPLDVALEQVPSIGEAVLGLGRVLADTWYGYDESRDVPQARAGDRHRQAETPGTLVTLAFDRHGTFDGAGWVEASRLHALTLGGILPVALVYDEDDPAAVIFGTLAAALKSRRDVDDSDRPHQLQVSSFPPAIWTP